MIARALYLSGLLMTAHGASKSPDGVRAQALAEEGRRLMAAGDYASACPKLSESAALDPGTGSALSLASCYEKSGKLASAWETLRNSVPASGRSDRTTAAKKRAAALEARLSRLTIAVSPSTQVAGLEIRCAGEPVPAQTWGVAVPRDGGGYDVQATAPGKRRWATHVDLRPSKQSMVVDVPPLEDESPSQASTQPDATEHANEHDKAPASATMETTAAGAEHPGRTQRVLGLALGGAGIVGVGVGGVLALMAKSQMNAAQTEPNPAAHNDSVNAVGTGNVATIVMGIGAAVAVTGAVVWLAAPDKAVTVGTSGGTLLVRGRF
jgi:hypothetical protein